MRDAANFRSHFGLSSSSFDTAVLTTRIHPFGIRRTVICSLPRIHPSTPCDSALVASSFPHILSTILPSPLPSSSQLTVAKTGSRKWRKRIALFSRRKTNIQPFARKRLFAPQSGHLPRIRPHYLGRQPLCKGRSCPGLLLAQTGHRDQSKHTHTPDVNTLCGTKRRGFFPCQRLF